jgi:hypothetical protein
MAGTVLEYQAIRVGSIRRNWTWSNSDAKAAARGWSRAFAAWREQARLTCGSWAGNEGNRKLNTLDRLGYVSYSRAVRKPTFTALSRAPLHPEGCRR